MSARRIAPTALALSTDAEKAAVLSELVKDDRELARRAEHAARSRLERVDADEVATTVSDALLALDQEELSAYAGRTRYGYVEPTEAAWWLLEQALEPWLEDITRRATLALSEAARRLGLGILQGLFRIRDRSGDDGLLLSWAPDFPSEAAERVIRVLSDGRHRADGHGPRARSSQLDMMPALDESPIEHVALRTRSAGNVRPAG